MTAEAWSEAWDLVTELGEPLAEVAPWRVENAGAIIVWRVGPRVAAVADGELEGLVESSIAPALREAGVGFRVKAQGGVVHLRGGFPSRQDAGRVIYAVLGVRGIDQIVSHLTWPGSELAPPRPRRPID